MKNFTNNFKQFTSRLSARWLIMALMMLVGTSSAWAATITSDGTARLYFNMKAVSWWTAGTNGNGNFAYFFNNSTNKNAWSSHSVNYSGDTYYVVVPSGSWEGVILTRNNTSTAPSWDNRWNQTGDITLSSTSNYISKFSEGSTSATWGTAVKPTSTASLTASSSSINVSGTATLTPELTSNESINDIKSTSYAISPSTGASITGNTFTATAAGTYTVTATITYNPKGYSSLTSTVTATTTITVNSSTYTVKKSETGGTGTVTLGGATITTNGVSISSGSKALSITAPTGYNVSSVTVNAGTLTPGTTGSSTYNGTVNVTAATTITITYVAKTYTITYKDQGGTNFSGTHANGYPTTHTYGTATELKTATKAGYTFGGWFTTSACTGNAVTSLGATAYSANITLYAKWTEVCNPISGLSWSITSSAKATYCPGDEVTVTMTYNGTTAKAYDWGGNYSGNIGILGGSIASGAQYTMTINKSGSVNLTLTGCDSKTAKTSTLTFEVVEAPVKPTISFSANPVGQNKPTTLTVGEYNGTLNNYTLYKDGESQGAYTTPQTITIGEVGEYDYRVVATSKACPSLTATSETVTLEVQEAGAKIVQLGDLTIYTNIKTDFVPMYVQKDGIVDVDGATSVKGYTWQYSQDGNSWSNCTTNYASGVVGMSNGGADCNNWRADKAGRYRCLITYNNDGTQYSNVLSVSAATTTAPAVNAFGDLPIVSVNTGSNSFPDECSVSNNQYPSANADKMKKKVSVDVKIYDKAGKLQYDRKARMNYRGSSSLNFKKKSYAFVTGKEKTKNDKGDVDTGKANLFGLSNSCEDKDWVLYAATPDPSMMRNRLVFDLYKKMTGEWGVNSMYVELIVNNEYKGVYVLMDKITNNENRVNITASGGFIVKFDKTDVVDRVENAEGDQKTFATTRTGTGRAEWHPNGITSYDVKIDQRFEIEYPEKEDVEDDGGNWEATYGAIQKRFEDFETALEEKDYTTVRSIIDYDSWADWFIINEYTKNMDAYRASCIFVYNGNKIEARPLWDQELSFNNVVANIQSVGANSTSGLLIQDNGVYSDAFKAPFWFTGGGTSITGGLLNDPCFVSLVKQKWATYKEGVLSSNEVNDMVDNYTTELTSNAITRENTMLNFNSNTRGQTSSCTGSKAIGYYGYGNNTGSATTHDNSRNAIKSWITSRIPALTTAINGLEGEALIFTVSPSTVETTPWQQVILTVNAPEGYEYTVDYSELTAAGAIIKEGNNTYGIKIPRPDGWGTAGNGDPDDSEEYEFTANIEVSGENACGTMQEGTATSTITLKDVTEECSPEVKP